jgi:hypothetical protein
MIGFIIPPLLIATIIWGFLQPAAGSTAYIVLVGLFEGWLLSAAFLAKPDLRGTAWSPEEQAVLKKYYVYFRFPFASRQFSSIMSGIQLAAFVWVPWLLLKGHWVRAIIIGANYLIAGPIAVRLNPRFFLHEAVEKRNQHALIPEMLAVDSVCEKIIEARNQPSAAT